MSEGYINIAIKEKFDGSKNSRKHLTNKGKHIMRQHNEITLELKKHKSIDRSRSHLNVSLISYQKPGETLNQAVNRFMVENEIETPKRNTTIRAVAGIISIPTEYLKDPEKLKVFEKNAKEFLETNEKLKGNVVLAQTNYDETSPHIEFVFVPRDNQNPHKLDFTKLYGTDHRKGIDGAKSLSDLHDEIALKVGKPLGLSRGDGTHTNKLSNKEYLKLISDVKNDEVTMSAIDIPEPPKVSEKPAFSHASRNIELIKALEKENSELRAYIKMTKPIREKLRTMRGITRQNNALKVDRKNLKNKIESQQVEINSNREFFKEAFDGERVSKADVERVRAKFKEIRNEDKLKKERDEKKKLDREVKENLRKQVEKLEHEKTLRQNQLNQEPIARKSTNRPQFRPPLPTDTNK